MSRGIGIVGLGAILDFHAKAAQALGEGMLVACCSRDAKKAQAFAEKYGCTPYASMEEFLRHPGLDIVSITTAAGHHMEPALQAIEAGKHLVIEKPIEISGTEGSAVLEETVLTTWEFANAAPADEEITRRFGEKESSSGGAADPLAISFEGHRKQFEDLVSAIDSGGKPFVDANEARKSVEIILAVYRSAREGKEVRL